MVTAMIKLQQDSTYMEKTSWRKNFTGRFESVGKLLLIPGSLIYQVGKIALKAIVATVTFNQLNRLGGAGYSWTFKALGRDLIVMARLVTDIFVKALGGIVLAPSKVDHTFLAYAAFLGKIVFADQAHTGNGNLDGVVQHLFSAYLSTLKVSGKTDIEETVNTETVPQQ